MASSALLTATRSFPSKGSATALCTVTAPSKGLYVLSMHNMPDNRLSPDFFKHAFIPALDFIELDFRQAYDAGHKEAALVLTGETVKHKFFSNGLSLELVAECPHFFRDYYYNAMRRLLTFPIATVAAINGHSFAGGFCLALACDYRVMKADPKSRAMTCMNEINFGAPLPKGMAAVMKAKLTPGVIHKVMLTAHRFDAPQALEAGIIDEVVTGDGRAVIERASEIAKANMEFSSTGVMSMMKETLYSAALKDLWIDEDMQSSGSPADLHKDRVKALTEAAVQPKL